MLSYIYQEHSISRHRLPLNTPHLQCIRWQCTASEYTTFFHRLYSAIHFDKIIYFALDFCLRLCYSGSGGKIYLIGMEWQCHRRCLALIYCDLYVHFCRTKHTYNANFKVAHWTITTWLVYETQLWHSDCVTENQSVNWMQIQGKRTKNTNRPNIVYTNRIISNALVLQMNTEGLHTQTHAITLLD